MPDDFLQQRHAAEGSKLHALLMAAAASGIAFALHETKDSSLGWSLILAAAAVLAWGSSFAAGVLNRRKIMQAIKSNVLRNEAEREGDQPKFDVAVEFFGKHLASAHFYQEAQLWTLLAGALLYCAGHVTHLIESP